MGAPEIVEKLAASVSGVPLKWHEYDDRWVIVMTDGRKYYFPKKDAELPRHEETLENYKENVSLEPAPHRKKAPRRDK